MAWHAIFKRGPLHLGQQHVQHKHTTGADRCVTITRMDFQTHYGIKIDPNRKPVRPIPLDLTSEAGQRLVLEAAKRVIAIHADVLAALTRR